MRTGSQPVAVGLAENPWPGSEGITRWNASAALAAVRRGIGERLDDLQLLDDRAGPAVRDDQRQRVLVLRADVDEVDVEPVDLGHEVRQGVQLRLAPAPVVVGRPVARELLHRRERHALRVVGDRLALGPPGRGDAPAQLGELRLIEADLERANGCGRLSVADICSSCHVVDVARGREEVDQQLVDALGLVVVDPVRGVGQALDAVEVGHVVVVGLGERRAEVAVAFRPR